MSKISEALDAWRRAVRELEIMKPGATDWDRARLEEEDTRAAYQMAAADARRRQHGDSERVPERLAQAPHDRDELAGRIDLRDHGDADRSRPSSVASRVDGFGPSAD